MATAGRIVQQKGYLGLNMNDIADRIEYSKGTIYQHFQSKEDLLVALVVQQLERRRHVLEVGTTFRGGSRERMVAVCEANRVFVEQNPDTIGSMALIRLDSILQKASGKRRGLLTELESSALNAVVGIVHDGLAHGDLNQGTVGDPQHLAFGVWALMFGAAPAAHGGSDVGPWGIREPGVAASASLDRLLDGFAWQPLSGSHDFAQTRRRVREQLAFLN